MLYKKRNERLWNNVPLDCGAITSEQLLSAWSADFPPSSSAAETKEDPARFLLRFFFELGLRSSPLVPERSTSSVACNVVPTTGNDSLSASAAATAVVVPEDSSGTPFLLRFFLCFRPISRREADLEPPVLGARHRLLSSNDPITRKVTLRTKNKY